MGRKLNALKEMQASTDSSDRSEADDRTDSKRKYMKLIADQLGIPIERLSTDLSYFDGRESVADVAPHDELTLTQQCTDLLRAFVQIQDPQDRVRCLQIVRDAARAKPPGAV